MISDEKKRSKSPCRTFLLSLLCIACFTIAILMVSYFEALQRAREAEDKARTSWIRAEREWRRKEDRATKEAESRASAYYQQLKQTKERVIQAQKATEGFETRIRKAEEDAAIARKDSKEFKKQLEDEQSKVLRMSMENEDLKEKLETAQRKAEEARKRVSELLEEAGKKATAVHPGETKVLNENVNEKEAEPTQMEPVKDCDTFLSSGWTKFFLSGTMIFLFLWRKVAVNYCSRLGKMRNL
ncbi:mitotic spindle assembly checkpoint protein MAD1-like isoform X2 [Penaeus japonicus]|uniref:mitotic spindle assembly checkpoint protein MAD1-like isoform X2 n=1 Tax=Penaeus japonicus TaxID=27405 RepID=UPI001C713955|nr:mitotic spindle assembly checkpoint protein MAD1-like isoform X2 [Penaeus japonicus]